MPIRITFSETFRFTVFIHISLVYVGERPKTPAIFVAMRSVALSSNAQQYETERGKTEI
jgi:hypothetical protein